MHSNSVATTDYSLANFATNLTPYYSDFCPVKLIQDANFEYRQQQVFMSRFPFNNSKIFC